VITATSAGAVDIDEATPGTLTRSFNLVLTLTVALGLVVRIAFVTLASFSPTGQRCRVLSTDGIQPPNGKGYSAPFFPHPGKLVATAAHPPLFSALLAALDLLGSHSVDSQRLALAFVTCSSVLVMGLFGRRVAGRWSVSLPPSSQPWTLCGFSQLELS
jgi:hypothetical protein